ncbi:maker310 [Drosophila busckii]|uniref:Maker310 n=1 Tax=Drosophila busckii TaxID=30019 RepID=A0A0M4F9J7_DROBS|nr:maker310 [Drosophila busckii]
MSSGFERGLEPLEIVGATTKLDNVIFFMKWKYVERVELVNSKAAKLVCPQLVIRFYEKHIVFVKDKE